jgi:hypothetical protein
LNDYFFFSAPQLKRNPLGGVSVTSPKDVSEEYCKGFAAAFSHPLQSNSLVSQFVTNPNVTGAYAEAWVRATVRSMLGHKFRISTGAVIRSTDKVRGLDKVAQCDLIVWDPSEFPALFECGDFALVPIFSVRAIIEVKRTVADPLQLLQQLEDRRKLLTLLGPVLGVVISHQSPLFTSSCSPDWLAHWNHEAAPPITRLLDSSNNADVNGVMAFIYFLAQVAGHTRPNA